VTGNVSVESGRGELPLLDGLDRRGDEQLAAVRDSALMTLPDGSTVVLTVIEPEMPICRATKG